MKKYTHAWLAFMAIKRLETAKIPAKQKPYAESLVRWFKNYRDFVIAGAWYPDAVFKDMAASHVIKYKPDTKSEETTVSFRGLPASCEMFQSGKASKLYGKPYTIVSGNCADRVEAFSHSIVDSLKIQFREEKGNPVAPSNNHIAMRFFILSHYVADCHMPLHCDDRQFSKDANVHGAIEEEWEEQVRRSYKIDYDNNRFFYDPDGYPLQTDEATPLIKRCEATATSRKYTHGWCGTNNNTWDFMSSVSQYSYLMAYEWFPQGTHVPSLTVKKLKQSEMWQHLEEDSLKIFGDAIDAIARIWLHAWIRFKDYEQKPADEDSEESIPEESIE